MIEILIPTINILSASGMAVILYTAAAGAALIILERPAPFKMLKSIDELFA